MQDNLNNISKNSKQEEFSKKYKKIENYIRSKENLINKYKHIPLEDIIAEAPKYYPLLGLLEKMNVFLTKDNKWLKHFVEKNNIHFDYNSYERWKANKRYHDQQYKYSDTQAPSKWIHVLQDYFLEILEYLQILLIMEFYIKDEDYKMFLKQNPEISFKMRANFISSSLPSEDLEKLFYIIDYLLNLNIEYNFLTTLVVETSLCMKVYREIDQKKIFDLLKHKEFYIKYRLEFLKRTQTTKRDNIPYEEEVIDIAEKFMKCVTDLKFTYKEYKNRLIEKYNKAKSKR